MPTRFDVIKRNKVVAFVQDATLYQVCEDGYSTPAGECEETPQAVKAAYLERLCDSNVPRSRINVQIVRRWMP